MQPAEITLSNYNIGHSLDTNLISRIDVDILLVCVSNPFDPYYTALELPKFLTEHVNMVRQMFV